MNTLKPVKCGWKWLQGVINDLIDAINERSISVSVGGGLDIQESQNGVLLTTSAAALAAQAAGTSTDTTGGGSTGGGGTGGGGGGGDSGITTPSGPATWVITNVVIETGTGYQIKQYYVLGAPV